MHNDYNHELTKDYVGTSIIKKNYLPALAKVSDVHHLTYTDASKIELAYVLVLCQNRTYIRTYPLATWSQVIHAVSDIIRNEMRCCKK